MSELSRVGEDQVTWYPCPIGRLESVLKKVLYTNRGYEHVYALRKNIAYNLQYIQFQDKVLQELKLSSVISTQTIKTIVLVGCSIIESLLHFLLIVNGYHTKTDWVEKISFKGNQKKLDGEVVRVDTVIYKKLPEEKLKHMSFDAMIKCAKSKHIFGSNKAIYEKLESLRNLRNKVHLQVINNPNDTDWNTFNNLDLSDVCKVLYDIFTSSLFEVTEKEEQCFRYLRRNFVA
ncbi:hypothetical protein [Moritella viscosa]|uniref:hypothetical protein n=1 Tax=Moritella viscosa TaxID=80854 RepID=UPI0009141ED8|nr:hypothetical protein [Moritella viscosa]SGY89625.1 Putative uncharacterized protein [Moritella viscosa]